MLGFALSGCLALSADFAFAQAPETEAEAPAGVTIEQQNLRRLMETEDYAGAAESGKRLVVLSIEHFGRNSMETANALTTLAIAQREVGEIEAARENFGGAVTIIEDIKDRLSKELIDPLQGLARTNMQASRPDAAAEVYERALHVSQVNEGPQNLDQVELLNELTEAYFALGDYDQADALQKFTVGLYQRVYSEDNDMRMVPLLYQRATWLNRMGFIVREQGTYLRIIRIVEKSDGRDSLELIPALTALGRTYVYSLENDAFATGERRLRRAVSIAKKNEGSTDLLRADTEIALADFHLLTGDRTGARRAYLRAWDLFDEESLVMVTERDERFAQPFSLSRQERNPAEFSGASVADFKDTYGADTQIGYVTVAYDVNTAGVPKNLEIIESVPEGYKDNDALSWVRRFKFRPRIDERKIVSTKGLIYRYEFSYAPARFEEIEGDGEASEEESETETEEST